MQILNLMMSHIIFYILTEKAFIPCLTSQLSSSRCNLNKRKHIKFTSLSHLFHRLSDRWPFSFATFVSSALYTSLICFYKIKYLLFRRSQYFLSCGGEKKKTHTIVSFDINNNMWPPATCIIIYFNCIESKSKVFENGSTTGL